MKRFILLLAILLLSSGVAWGKEGELNVAEKDIFSYTYKNPKGEIWTTYDKAYIDGSVFERVIIKHNWIYFQRYENGEWITSPIMSLNIRISELEKKLENPPPPRGWCYPDYHNPNGCIHVEKKEEKDEENCGYDCGVRNGKCDISGISAEQLRPREKDIPRHRP